jgi:hypothetical protein
MSEVTYPPGQAGEEKSTTDAVKEKAQQATGQVQEKADDVKSQAGERIRDQIDTRSTQMGEQVTSLAETFRKTGEQLRTDGKDSHARMADRAAETVGRLGSYLTGADSDRMLRDAENFGRRRPWAFALAGGTVGLFAARFLKSSSSRRYRQSVGSQALPAGERRSAARETAVVTPAYQEL